MNINDIANLVNEDDLPDLSSATDLCAKYHVRDMLGRGVSSTVRRCFDKSDYKEYAIKIMDLTADPGILVSIQSEINVLKQCAGHPNIIELHDVFQTATFFFLVLEMCKGGELFEHLNNRVKLSEKRTRHVMRQLLEAVEYIHSKNIVHRDLKPENILLDESFNVKVSDFGFAVNINSDTELKDLFGTPSYMAPEVFHQSMYDNAPGYGRPVDMWATGVIMHTLLAGSPPFWNRRQHIMIRQIMDGKYSLSSTEWDGVSQDAKDLIKGMLVVDPSKRFTAKQCLKHPFFRIEEVTQRTANINLKFHARRKFKAGGFVVAAIHRMHLLKIQDSVVSLDEVTNNPYEVRPLRNLIDMGAFRIYGHWVKKGENQNRAALFENVPRHDANGHSTWN